MMHNRIERRNSTRKRKSLSAGEAIFASLLSWMLAAVLTGPSREGVARAYIDPGSGSLLLQLVIASFVGLMFYLRSVRQFFGRAFRGLRFRKKPDAD
jgi:hypothetical protein